MVFPVDSQTLPCQMLPEHAEPAKPRGPSKWGLQSLRLPPANALAGAG